MFRFLATVLVAIAAFAHPAFAATFRAPGQAAPAIVVLEAMPKRLAAAVEENGRLRVGDVRDLPKAVLTPGWQAVAGGWVTRFTVTSAGAEGLRVKLALGAVPGMMDVRVQGAGDVESMLIEPRNGPEAWTPLTDGDTQVIEVFSTVLPAANAVTVAAVVHQTASPLAKAAGTCTVPVNCSTGTPTLDTAIAQAKKSMMRILFTDGGGSFVCTATLIDTARRPSPYVMTANHCIGTAASASSISTLWFYENATCDAASTVSRTQVAGGMQLVFGNHNVDATLMLMNGSPPAGAYYAPVNRVEMSVGESIVSLSHPSGDTARLALGSVSNQYRLIERPQDFNAVRFTRGIIEGGSSGSGLFTLAGSTLQFRGTLLGTTTSNSAVGMSCTDTNEEALYSRFDIFAPEVDAYIGTATVAADDSPNRPQDVTTSADITPSGTTPGTFARDGLRIDYAGDLDTFKFTLASAAVVSAWTEGATNLDTVGAILDGDGSWIASNDDAQTSSNHMGVTAALAAGTYYVQVGHWDPSGVGPYNLRVRADSVAATNYTDLWSSSSEPGWGININHQGNLVFASLFTYDTDGTPMWLAMPGGQAFTDASTSATQPAFTGTLYRYTGAPFNGAWRAANATAVGTMTLRFSSTGAAQLQYSVNGVNVTKAITRFVFLQANTCTWSAFDRTISDNYQDLWYDAAEPGWGLNLAHQIDGTGKELMFASLFTYDANGNGLWLYMSSGTKVSSGKYTGTLYRNTGVPFSTVPWVPGVPLAVGSMTVTLTDGANGTLQYTYNGSTVTKPITRFVYATPKPDCSTDIN